MKVAVLALCVAAVAALPQSRIMGGTEVDIASYPFVAALLRYDAATAAYSQHCVGSIINNRSILTSINCFGNDPVSVWRARLASSNATSGGVIYFASTLLFNPNFDRFSSDGDVALMRTTAAITESRIALAGPNYIVNDDSPVAVLGWGTIRYGGPRSDQLLKADLVVINQNTCQENYNIISMNVTVNMLCAGTAEGGADFCEYDIGAPLVHNNVLIGIASWGATICGMPNYPGVYTRVNRYLTWIQENV